MDDKTAKELVNFQVKRKVTNLYKTFLFVLEDLQAEGYNIPDETYQRIRKRILDNGNDCQRELEELIEKFQITLKKG